MVTTVLGLVHLHAPTSQTRPPGAEAPPPPPPPPPGVASATADDGGGSRDMALAALVVLWFVIDIQSVIFHHARFWDVLKRHRRETVDDSLGVKMAAMYWKRRRQGREVRVEVFQVMREMQQLKLKRIEKAVKRIEALIYKEENKGEASAAPPEGDPESPEGDGGGGVFGFFGGGKKKAEAEEAKAAAAAEDEKGTTYGFVTAVTELHGAMKEVERRRDVERDRRERRGESQLVAVKPHARDGAGAPLVEKYEGEELCSHCLRALIRAGARGKDLFGVQQDWLGSSEMMKATRCAAQFWRNSGGILAQLWAIILRRLLFTPPHLAPPYRYVLEYEHGVVPKPRWADLTDKDMTSQRTMGRVSDVAPHMRTAP